MRLIAVALPLRGDLKSGDVLGCKPSESTLWLHSGCTAVITDQTSASTCASCFDRPVLSCASFCGGTAAPFWVETGVVNSLWNS